MTKHLLFLLAVSALLAGLAQARVSYQGHKVLRVWPTPSQAELLASLCDTPGFIPWSTHVRVGHPYDIQVAPERVDFIDLALRRRGDTAAILIDDLQRVLEVEQFEQEASPRLDGKISFDRYYRHEEINNYLDELEAQHGELVTLESVGKTTEGRDMKLIKISKGGEGNPILFLDAGIHAREWIAPAQALYVIHQLVENSTNHNLLDGLDWFILPVVNPDGYEYSHEEDRMWRKTRSTDSSKQCPGVDANRNYGHHWGEGGTSSNTCSEIFRGPKAFSEPETQNLREYLDKTDNIQLYLTLHSYGEYLLYPWSYTSTYPDNWQDMEELAHKADDAQASAGGNHYTIGQSTVLFGETAGSADDWAMGGAHIPMAFTIELPGGGSGGFDMPPSRIEGVVRPFFEAFRAFGEHLQSASR